MLAACVWGQDNSISQPAGILVTNWDCGTSAAFVINSLNRLEADIYQGVQQKQQSTESIQKMILGV